MCRYTPEYVIENVNGHYEIHMWFDKSFVASADTLPEAYHEIELDKAQKVS